MAKAIKKQVEVDSSGAVVVTEDFNSAAFSIVNENGLRKLIKVPLNTDSLVTGTPEVIAESNSGGEIQNEFKLAIVRAGLFK